MAAELITVGVACADVMARPIDKEPEPGTLTLISGLEMHLGGLAAVTAVVYAQLGGRSAFIGKAGHDGFGDYIEGFLRQQGVEVSGFARAEGCGTSATVVLISSEGERTFLHHVGANASLCEEDIDFEQVRRAKVLHWGGPSITPGLDGEPIGRVFKRAKSVGVTTSIDTCYDGTGTWYPLIEHALPHTDIVMSSLEEARRYTGQETPEDIAGFYRSKGAQIAVVKLGADGLYLESAEERHQVPAHKVTVKDTTGAGDAACAGFLYGYLAGWDLLRSARLANAVGGLTVQHVGGAEAIRSLKDTLAFMEAEPHG